MFGDMSKDLLHKMAKIHIQQYKTKISRRYHLGIHIRLCSPAVA